MKLSTRTDYSRQFHALDAADARGDLLIHIRPIAPDDEQRLIDFFRSHTAATIHLRYGMMMREMSHQRALELVQARRPQRISSGRARRPARCRIHRGGRALLSGRSDQSGRSRVRGARSNIVAGPRHAPAVPIGANRSRQRLCWHHRAGAGRQRADAASLCRACWAAPIKPRPALARRR